MVIQIRKAARQKAKLRVGISGPSGSGKTFSSLLIAKGMMAGKMEKVAVIDTENRSADLFSHLGDYNVITLEAPYTPEKYIEAIKAAEEAGMEVIIIDSVTHEWDGKGGMLESNELIAQSKFRGNTWAAWSVSTPRHQKFLEAITGSKVHIITTARSKTDTIQTEDKKIKKVGLKDIQREGFEYELTLNFNLDRDRHFATASKDRTGIFSEIDPFIIDEKTGVTLREWCEAGTDAAPIVINQAQLDAEENKKKEQAMLLKKKKINDALKTLGFSLSSPEDIAAVVKLKTQLDLIAENYDEIHGRLCVLIEEQSPSKSTSVTEPLAH